MTQIADAELERLQMLELQAAQHGPLTPVHILIEIAELRNKVHKGPTPERKIFLNQLDYDFVMNVVAAALVRLSALESALQTSTKRRDLVLLGIAVMIFAVLVLLLLQK